MADTVINVFDSSAVVKAMSQRTNADSSFSPNVSTEGKNTTYSLVIPDLTALAATTTDFFQLMGSATKKVKLRSLEIRGVATAVSFDDYYLVKRTAANTAGTAVSQAALITRHVTADAAAAAVPFLYTVNPTTLGAGTNLRAHKLLLPAVGTPAESAGKRWDFSNLNDEAPAIDGIVESFCLNRAGAAVIAGTSLYLTVEWTEE